MVVAMSMLQLFSVLLLTACSALPHSVTHTIDDHTEEGQNRQLKTKWASVFPGLTSTTVPLECEFKGGPICCSALKNTSTREPPSGVPLQLMSGLQRSGECVTKKEYFPSPYETRHFEKAKEIAQVPHVSNRHRLLMQFISLPEEVIAAQKWLERVRVHMSLKEAGENKSQRKGHLKSAHMQRLRNINANLTGRMHGRADKKRSDGDRRRADATGWLATSVHPDDAEYMSKFVLTTTCEGGASYQSTEWIEPLSVHARHPFGMSHCTYKETASVGKEMAKSGVSDIKKASLFSADYILLQEADSLPEYEVTSSKIVRKTKKYLFDAGTSRFDSSLFWFTCAFAQRFIDFDSIFGWEYSLLNPRDFWSHVPPRWKPLYHFFNKGITASPTDTDSVQTLLKQLGVTKNDFVAFKLDIDTPVIEVPIAMDLLNEDAGFGDLIDEFFFELHFRCEIMMYCGWNSEMPGEFNGLRMDRYGALQFFGDLRRRGIRAHFWP